MPNALGIPCWEPSNISRAITSTAKVDSAQKDYFLASHTPIDGITNDKTKAKYTEESFFEELFNPSHGNILSIIHGDPGTGKSHLIQWLKLRCEDKIDRGEFKNLVPVLVQRRDGSLKDALEQIVEQLGTDFEQYIGGISNAIGLISEVTARIKFANEFFFELHPGHRGQKLATELQALPEVFMSEGFREWLCREGGAIDRNLKRLTDSSELEDREREMFPQFSEAEFAYEPRRRGDDAIKVLQLVDDLNDEPELREQAALLCNRVLPNVIRQCTGLTGGGLMNIFDKIRAELKKQGKVLAIFIEDISVMSALNEDVYLAVEPREQDNLCRMVAVLGLTVLSDQKITTKLPGNSLQRITHPVSVGGQTSDAWGNDVSAVAKFSARYLNTVRLDRAGVKQAANNIRQQSDKFVNACKNCEVKDKCHSTFGHETIGEEEVGMFPFARIAPQWLLSHLSEHETIRKSPRGLLTEILGPILKNGYEQLHQGHFPSMLLAVSLPPSIFWTAFEQNYCGGWNKEDKKRLKFLAEGWIHAQNAEQAARKLKPLLSPLHFPDFSGQPLAPILEPPVVLATETSQQGHGAPVKDERGLQRVLRNLQDWHSGKPLVGDLEIRDMLSRFFRESLPWNDELTPPLGVWKKLVQSTTNKPFDITGMLTKQKTLNFWFYFERDDESLSLFESLLQFESNSGWNFLHSETYKRKIFGWLRHNAASQLQSIQPKAPLDPSLPVKIAAQLLALLATIRRRSTLPTEPHRLDELVEEVLTDPAVVESIGLSSEWQKLLQNLIQRGPELRQFLVDETMVPQGRTGSANFINPLPIIDGARDFIDNLHVDTLNETYFTGHLTSRYHPLRGANLYSDLSGALSAEQKAIRGVTDEILAGLRGLGFETEDSANAVIEFCTVIPTLANTVSKADVFVPNATRFDGLKNANVFVKRRDAWAIALRNAVEVANADNLEKVLIYDTGDLVELGDTMEIVADFVSRTAMETEKLLNVLFPDGDPDVYFSRLIETLRIIEGTNTDDGISQE